MTVLVKQYADEIRKVASRMRTARGVFVLTGSGVSAESGIPTFRGAGGLWRKFRSEDLASVEGFRRNPRLVWEWYNERKRNMREARPNPAHTTLASWDKRYRDFMICTQNIDNLHQRGGANRVVEIHGSILRSRCMATGRVYEDHEVDTEREIPPHSPAEPEALLRPDIVWFGEYLPPDAVEEVQTFLETAEIDAAFVIGTTAQFGYIVSWALMARQGGAMLVEINPSPCLHSLADVTIAAPAGEILPAIDNLIVNHNDNK